MLAATIAALPGPAEARQGERTLKLYFANTGERGEFTYKRHGRFDRGEMDRINRFLRDWRRNEPANMDPQLLDLVWAIYKESGSKSYISVVSAYRSPATNAMLRSRSSGVAEKSQHMTGKALDFYLPDVNLDRLRSIAMRLQGGGVGYYPRSGSPFVHVDTGNVRAWPRMTRQQLVALFPDGETLHLPTDGKPLPGYQRALARRQSGGGTQLAYVDPQDDAGGERQTVGGWLKRVFDGGADEAEDNEMAGSPAATPAPAPATAAPEVLVATAAPLEPRLPKPRPADTALASLDAFANEGVRVDPDDANALATLSFAPLPRSRPDSAVLAASLSPHVDGPASLQVAAEDALAALAARSDPPAAEPAAELPQAVVVAYAETGSAAPESPSNLPLAAVPPADLPADSALEAANRLGKGDAQMPRPRPLAVAFTGADLATSAPALAAAPGPAAPATAAPAEPAVVMAALQTSEPAAETMADHTAPPSAPIVVSASPARSVDESVLRQLIAAPAAHERGFGDLAMPQPSGAPGLFTVPEGASGVPVFSEKPSLPTGRFQQADRPTLEPASLPEQAEAKNESFFSRLFASLAN